MAIFSIAAPSHNALIGPKIAQQFPGNYIEAWPGHWFLSAEGTAAEIGNKLGVVGGETGTVVVIAVSGYYGWANVSNWEWIRSHWAAKT